MPTGQEPKASVSTTFSSPWPLVFFPSSLGSLKQCLMPIPWVSFLAFFLFRLYHVLLSSVIYPVLSLKGWQRLDILFRSQSIAQLFVLMFGWLGFCHISFGFGL